MTKPTLTVLIDTYNHERYIEQAIISVIEQDFPASEYEILVVDDGSSDSTPDIVRKFAPRVRLLRKKNGGQASAFNAGIPEACGKIVSFLDGDDWFAPGKLTAVATALEAHPQAGAVGHGHFDFQEKSGSIGVYTPPRVGLVGLENSESACQALVVQRSLLMGALTLRKETLNRVLPISEQVVFCADTPIQMAALAAGAFVLEQPLFYYRHHEGSLYSSDRQNLSKMRRRLDVHKLALESSFRTLIELGVATETAREIIGPAWVHDSRTLLSTFGGSPWQTFRTEIQSADLEGGNWPTARRYFKKATLAATTLVLPPRAYYKARNWRLLSRSWYYLLNVTYAARHSIRLNRRRIAESGEKAGN